MGVSTLALINETLERTEKSTVMDQYKLYVEMADRISQRRNNTNTFFISINAALFATSKFFGDPDSIQMFFVCVLGMVISIAWFFILSSYRQLNSKKYDVILEIEKQLPIMGYTYEWELMKKDRGLDRYIPLSLIESVVPLVFVAAYIIMEVIQCSL